MSPTDLWKRYQEYLCSVEPLGLSVDISRMHFEDGYFEQMAPAMQSAFKSMDELEAGAIANPDEGRMVGHYWLRAPELAPSPEITADIKRTLEAIKAFAAKIHAEGRFRRLLLVGIGGSALGPMLVADALGDPASDRMQVLFVDNTDPDGIARTLKRIQGKLDETLVVITSKSGGTPETRNGMILVAAAFRAGGVDFPSHAVAVTMPGSKMDKQAEAEGWLARFPMFDWVGGRTSELSAVGLLPAALQGVDIDAMLAGAAECDRATRLKDARSNPAAVLALMWFQATGGRGAKDMVVLPYKDRLLLFSRYLQQLVMESLGKRLGLDGKRVDQGIAVYGNKGSTDQHAYVQQLRDGVNNFFAVFVRVLESGGDPVEVEPGVLAGDYLHGLLLGTREALFANDRQSITITIRKVDARSMGTLIALFERAVGFYASLVHINAYHQPGVEAGKKAASQILELQKAALGALSGEARTALEIARAIGHADAAETVYQVLEHLAANGRARVSAGAGPGAATFRAA